jgi:hypothetical protein
MPHLTAMSSPTRIVAAVAQAPGRRTYRMATAERTLTCRPAHQVDDGVSLEVARARRGLQLKAAAATRQQPHVAGQRGGSTAELPSDPASLATVLPDSPIPLSPGATPPAGPLSSAAPAPAPPSPAATPASPAAPPSSLTVPVPREATLHLGFGRQAGAAAITDAEQDTADSDRWRQLQQRMQLKGGQQMRRLGGLNFTEQALVEASTHLPAAVFDPLLKAVCSREWNSRELRFDTRRGLDTLLQELLG